MSRPKYKDAGSPETRVIEECSELILSLCKAGRNGWFSFHPGHPASSNMDYARRKMDDAIEAMNKLDGHLQELRFEHFVK